MAFNGNPFQYSCLKIPWTKEPSGLRSKGSQRVRHDWVIKHKIFSRLRNHHHYWIPERFHHSPKKAYYSLTIIPHFPIALPPSPWQPGFHFQSQQICLFSCILYAIIRAYTWWHLLWLPWGTLRVLQGVSQDSQWNFPTPLQMCPASVLLPPPYW